jgi:putative molybdopterin biosynthesis protein
MVIQRIQSEEGLKILGDATRLAILQRLISAPATISQLGGELGQHPARIRNHLKRLEKAGMVELQHVQTVKNYQEKYYRATARAFFVNLAVFPRQPASGLLVILGSDDPALDLMAANLNRKADAPHVYVLPVGSLDGLIYLRENLCQVSGCHLFDAASGEYNLPYVRLLFSGQPMVLLTLAHRQQGLLVAKGNPKNIRDLLSYKREDLTIVNRKLGSGTRLWLDQQLRKLEIDPNKIKGYDSEISTHAGVAYSIVSGMADVGLGIYAAAREYDLDFIPLFEERYDLVMTEAMYSSAALQPLCDLLQNKAFRCEVEDLGGYDTTHMGEVIKV